MKKRRKVSKRDELKVIRSRLHELAIKKNFIEYGKANADLLMYGQGFLKKAGSNIKHVPFAAGVRLING